MISEILKLAIKVGVDLLIRPFFGDEGGYDYSKFQGWTLTAHKRAVFYFRKKLILTNA